MELCPLTCIEKDLFTIYVHEISVLITCADPEGGRGSRPPSEKNKAIGFLSNTGPDPLKILQR